MTSKAIEMLALWLLSLQTVITVYRTDMIPIRDMAMGCTSKLYRATRPAIVKKPPYLPVRLYPARTHGVNEEGYWATKLVRRHRASQKTMRQNVKEHHWGQDTEKALDLEVI